MTKRDPQLEVDIPQRFIDAADARVQENILTSVDEEAYTNGDWTEKIHELAAELWAEHEENEKISKAEHDMQREKDERAEARQ